MKTIVLAEKPSQASDYANAFQKHTKKQGYFEVSDPVLANETFITYGFGHLVELASPEQYDTKYKKWDLKNLPIFPEKYKFIVPKDKKGQFSIVSDLIKDADQIIIATDSDREGENIAWSILNKAKIDLKSKDIKRLWINSLEKESILNGFKNLKDGWEFYNFFKEAQTRQISDWLIGMNASPLFTIELQRKGINGVYSIGRVQTPTLYLVYKRYLEIKNFKPTPYFEINAEVQAGADKFNGKLDPYIRFSDKNKLNDFAKEKNIKSGVQEGIISDVKKNLKKSQSPRLFSLSDLQTEVNKRYHASASDTLKAVQKLYEQKILTYPRTDCNFITDNEFNYLKENLSKYISFLNKDINLNNTNPNKRYVDSSKVQEHHAIILTKTVPSKDNFNKLSDLEKKIYQLVLKTTLAMFADPFEYEETVILTKVNLAIFKTIGKTPKNIGWKELFSEESKESKDDENLLPAVTIGDIVKVDLSVDQKETKPPIPYTEGTLIKAMKTAGKDLDDEEDQEILKDIEGIGTEATRANILETLKNKQYLLTEKNKLTVSQQGITLCKAVELEPLLASAEMTAKWEKALKQIGQKQRTQDNFLEQIKKFITKIINDLPNKMNDSPILNSQIEEQITTQKEIETESEISNCPICKTGKILDKGKFYGCSNYNADEPCKFSLPKKWSEKTLSKTIVKELIEKGETKIIKGFKSKKTGKKFDAKLKLSDGKLSFNFDKGE
ncbi:DNA topoisomerase III [Lactococcus cremoris]|uniref:type IA DNA topoisomerase n=1 Tax=Lactococcus TaxID=1357 RepID=UPI00038AD532|nr:MULTISPECIES: type IA DNA topoisomerase [Lactococcus]EQC83930.1 hypothetical protein LLT1_03160 [Lactococcus cremoris subsp. cremoris TIFN1]MCT3116841.1 type IA DNA topoisomerase [Lactococcus lactis]MDT2868963.1 DNA topoisomerase III [Lactococcus lactis]MRL66899.1 DNA topoisomerase III [Lactococcus lactis subsp. lactis]OAJ96589.1 DNA topoisomerase III [Lactococcus lactis]